MSYILLITQFTYIEKLTEIAVRQQTYWKAQISHAPLELIYYIRRYVCTELTQCIYGSRRVRPVTIWILHSKLIESTNGILLWTRQTAVCRWRPSLGAPHQLATVSPPLLTSSYLYSLGLIRLTGPRHLRAHEAQSCSSGSESSPSTLLW